MVSTVRPARVPSPANNVGEHERLFFSHSQDGMILLQVKHNAAAEPRFLIELENEAAFTRLSQLGQEIAFAGKDIKEVLPAWLHTKLLIHYAACVSSRSMRRYEITHGGSTHESIATPIFGADGTTVEHVAVVMRDIDDRVQQERKLNIALARAEEANRSKSQFFASMSHELRTPLNAILGFSEMMEKGFGGTLSDSHIEYVEHIHSSGQHLLTIISDILDLSKIEAGQFRLHERPTPVAEIVESCVQMVRERAVRKQIPLNIEVEPNISDLMADPVRIKQILLNLLTNAIKFTDEGSVSLIASHDEKGITFRVVDTGIGMDTAELETAQQPFGQVEDAYARNRDGTGLGLSIARHLIEVHGGSLELRSEKARGTEAIVTLPPERAIRRSIAC